MLDAVVLAAGQSKRFLETGGPCIKQLYDVELATPYPMEMSLLSHHVLQLSDSSVIDKIYIVVSSQHADQIAEKVTLDLKGYGLDIEFIDIADPRNTYATLWQAAKQFKIEGWFMITMGDHLVNSNGIYRLGQQYEVHPGFNYILADTNTDNRDATTNTFLLADLRNPAPGDQYRTGKIHTAKTAELLKVHLKEVVETGVMIMNNDLECLGIDDYATLSDYYLEMVPIRMIDITPYHWINVNTFQDIQALKQLKLY